MITPAAQTGSGTWWVCDEPWPTGKPTGIRYFPFQAADRSKIPANFNVDAGPFQTKAEATSYIDQHFTGHGGTGSGGSGPPQSEAGIPTLPNPLGFLGFLGEIGHWLGILVTALTDIHTYISLGWLLLGLLFLVAGIIWWQRENIGRAAALVAEGAAAGA